MCSSSLSRGAIRSRLASVEETISSRALSLTKHFDLVVIGSGPAGRRAAIQGAKAGCHVLVIEKGRKLGGVSVHTGTIPSKTLRETVLNLTGWRERGFYGRSYRVKTNISQADLQKRLSMTLEHEVEVLEHQFARNRVATIHGAARFVTGRAVEVLAEDGQQHRVSADHIVIAVGTAPYRPSHIPFDGVNVLDSDEILNLAQIPRRLTVIGGGVIGLEYATIFSVLDVQVTLVDQSADILPFVDRELVSELLHELRQRGVALRLGSDISSVDRQPNGCRVVLVDGRKIHSDTVLYAAGRVGATATLGLEATGICPDQRGRIAVDPLTFRTTCPNIFAAGDVIGFPSLASTSMEQGRLAACHALGLATHTFSKHFPYGIYTVPELSVCGISEEVARQQGIAYEVGTAR